MASLLLGPSSDHLLMVGLGYVFASYRGSRYYLRWPWSIQASQYRGCDLWHLFQFLCQCWQRQGRWWLSWRALGWAAIYCLSVAWYASELLGGLWVSRAECRRASCGLKFVLSFGGCRPGGQVVIGPLSFLSPHLSELCFDLKDHH